MKRILSAVSAMFLASVPASVASNAGFHWPDSSKYWRAIVNANQFMQNYVQTHPQWFSQDKLVTDFTVIRVPPGGHDAAVQQYNKVRQFLESKGMYVGTYVSGRAVIATNSNDRRYPRARVSIEAMPSTTRFMGALKEEEAPRLIDVTDAQSCRALQSAIKQIWESSPAPLRFVDNIPPHSNGPPWEATCTHMKELRRLGESLGSRVIFNIPIHVGELSEPETRELIDAVGNGGIALEMPWLPYIRESAQATQLAQKRYRELLDSGMSIIMIPIKTPEHELSAWVRSWRKPSDHLYLACPFFMAPAVDLYQLR